MAITNHDTGKVAFIGCVIRLFSQYHYDGMEDEFAVVWNTETKQVETHTVGYYGSDWRNLMSTSAEVDLTPENAREILHYAKMNAYKAFERSVQDKKAKLYKDDICTVVRGRKVKKGTVLKVFWCGEKPTYRSQMYAYLNETETIAGCYDEQGNKVWIKAEYLEKCPQCQLKSPCAAERRKFVKWYMQKNYADIQRIAE